MKISFTRANQSHFVESWIPSQSLLKTERQSVSVCVCVCFPGMHLQQATINRVTISTMTIHHCRGPCNKCAVMSRLVEESLFVGVAQRISKRIARAFGLEQIHWPRRGLCVNIWHKRHNTTWWVHPPIPLLPLRELKKLMLWQKPILWFWKKWTNVATNFYALKSNGVTFCAKGVSNAIRHWWTNGTSTRMKTK